VGNIVSYQLRGCEGCACHEYDHIIPYSKGGKTIVENCQILQTRVNRFKGADNDNPSVMHTYSCTQSPRSTAELDLMEIALYGTIDREGLHCRVASEFEEFFHSFSGPKKKKLPPCPNATTALSNSSTTN